MLFVLQKDEIAVTTYLAIKILQLIIIQLILSIRLACNQTLKSLYLEGTDIEN